MSSQQLNKIKDLENLYGNTPVVEVTFKYKNKIAKIYGKYEAVNFSGSIKDRIAIHILRHAYENNLIKIGDVIVEATSGNTGIAFSALGRALGHEVVIFMPDWLSNERYDMITLYGAKVVKITKEQGGFLRSIAEAENYVKTHQAFCPRQFSNPINVESHYNSTAKEFFNQLQQANIAVSHFVAGVGTGGTIMGFLKYCQSQNLAVKCHPMEPSNSPTLSTGGKKIGKHRIQGISDEFIPEILKLNQLEKIIGVDDSDAIIMAQKLNKVGLSVGISSGANFIAALKIINENPAATQVATIFCDSALKYLSTDLLLTQNISDNMLALDVDIVDIKIFK